MLDGLLKIMTIFIKILKNSVKCIHQYFNYGHFCANETMGHSFL